MAADYLTMAAVLGVEAILVKPQRGIGPFTAEVTLREVHTDELEITDHPVEMGAMITDHAFKKPQEVVIECAWPDSPQTGNGSLVSSLAGAVTGTLAGVGAVLSGQAPGQMKDLYEKLLDLQASRSRFDVYTGKRVYHDMLLKTLVVTTDKQTENILHVTATLRQVIIVKTQVLSLVSAPVADQMIPMTTAQLLMMGTKQLQAGLPHMNIAAAAQSLTSSSVAQIAQQAINGAKSPAALAQLFF